MAYIGVSPAGAGQTTGAKSMKKFTNRYTRKQLRWGTCVVLVAFWILVAVGVLALAVPHG